MRRLALIASACLLAFPFPIEGATRVALVDGSPAPDKTCSALVDLAASELSAADGIELLERDAIDRVLAEQNLAGSQLAGAEGAVRIGALLKVDVYAVLECSEGLKGAGLVAFDVQTGERLRDSALASGALDDAAGEVRAAVEDAVRKRALPAAERRAVCLLAVRNTDMPRSMDPVCEAIGLLLERNLLRGSPVSVLERRRLDTVLAERELAGTREDSLRASVVTIDLDVSRGNDTLSATALLKDASGADLATCKASAPVNEPADLAARLASAILEQLGSAAASAPADRAVEAARFAAESALLFSHNRVGEAARAMEAACALEPRPEYLARLGIDYAMLAAATNKDDAARASAYTARALDLSADLQYRTEQGGPMMELRHYMFHVADARSTPSVEQEALRVRYLELLMARERDDHERAAGRLPPLEGGGSYGTLPLMQLEHASRSGAEFARHAATLMAYWLDDVHRSGVVQRWEWDKRVGELIRTSHASRAAKSDDGYISGMRDIAKLFMQDTNRVIQLYGECIDIIVSSQDGMDPVDLQARIDAFDREGRRWIEEAAGPRRKPNIYQTYLALLQAYDAAGEDRAYRAAKYQDLFDFMIGRKELVPYVGFAATESSLGTSRYMGRQRGSEKPLDRSVLSNLVRNCDLILVAFGDPAFTTLDGGGELWQTFTKPEIERRRNDLAQALGLAGPVAFTARQVYEIPRGGGAFQARTLVGDDLYVASMVLRDGGNIAVARIHLPEGSRTDLASLQAKWADDHPREGVDTLVSMVPALAVEGGRVFVGTAGAGCFVIDPPSRNPLHIGQAAGLPSDHVQSLAVAGGVLYAGLGASTKAAYIVAYDLAARSCEVIASSQRMDKKTPLDNLGIPFFVRAMRPDPERNRIILVVDCGQDTNSKNDYRPEIGIWELRLPSRELRQLVQLNRAMRWVSDVRGYRILLAPWSNNHWQPGKMFRPWYGAVEFEFATDRARIAYANVKSPAGPGLNIAPDTVVSEHLLYPPYFDTADGFWGVKQTLSRLSRDGGGIESSPDAMNIGGNPQWSTYGMLERLEDGRLVGAARFTVWLIEPAAK